MVSEETEALSQFSEESLYWLIVWAYVLSVVEFPEVACYHNLVQQELALYGIGLGNEEFLFRGKYLSQHMHTGCGKTAHIETFQYVHCVVAFLWRESCASTM